MSRYSPGRNDYESDGSVDESRKSYCSEEEEEEDDSSHGREYNIERYALQRRQPPGELTYPLVSENKELRDMNKNLIYKVCALKLIQKNLTSEIHELKDALRSLSLKNDALIQMNEELRETDSEENAKTSFNIGAYGVNFRLNRETGNKQRMKQKFRE